MKIDLNHLCLVINCHFNDKVRNINKDTSKDKRTEQQWKNTKNVNIEIYFISFEFRSIYGANYFFVFGDWMFIWKTFYDAEMCLFQILNNNKTNLFSSEVWFFILMICFFFVGSWARIPLAWIDFFFLFCFQMIFFSFFGESNEIIYLNFWYWFYEIDQNFEFEFFDFCTCFCYNVLLSDACANDTIMFCDFYRLSNCIYLWCGAT